MRWFVLILLGPLTLLAGAPSADTLATTVGGGAVQFAWSGATTPTSIKVNAKLTLDTSSVRLVVSRFSDLSHARVSAPHVADSQINDRVVSIVMKGLDPGTRYFYSIEVEGQPDPTHQGSFSTPVDAPMSFTFALGACAETGSAHDVFDTVRLAQPSMFLHLGDMHYADISTNDPSLFRSAFEAVLGSLTQSALYLSTPIAYMWDDHDYGSNNSDRFSPGRESARLVYQQYVPHHALAAGSGDVAIYQAFSMGRVRFLLTDVRSERDPYTDPDSSSKTMLGAEQRAWLEQELLEARDVYPVIVWVNTVPWIGATGDDGWYAYPDERAAIADFIADNEIRQLLMLSGDAHMLAIDDGSNSDYSSSQTSGFPVFHAGALDRPGSVKGGPYSHGAFPGGGQFGLMTVVDDGVNPICVAWSGRNDADQELLGLQFCQGTPPPADTDGDGVDDVDECSFADDGLWAPPTRVTDLRLVESTPGSIELHWPTQDMSAGPGTSYDVVSGTIEELRQDSGFDRAGCLADDHPDTPYLDPSVDPLPGQARYYLLRAHNGCGAADFGTGMPDNSRGPLDSETPCSLP